ncbi:N-terminal acetyltransferase B complex auxiliary subunit NAA25 [Vitis vinifera]|uniref:N-terminal acetyltransferase B complex auxiliary subunit NAA25 n=1 Tax=Vitis vinifera TaxID=29760 RepID=A0A438KND7_VITVI|nr:N-terminal acetyltransferase B complex auxiliary subunit NAA25 [Vitis vinifera]
MASKFGMAGGIPERRVRPIWDAIDSRQFKNAPSSSLLVAFKYPQLSLRSSWNQQLILYVCSCFGHLLHALKALILERMGKSDEALSVCLSAKELLYTNDSVLMDELTLSTLARLFSNDLITWIWLPVCYEYACGKFLNNLEIMMGLFNCYVREYSFVKQQQVSCVVWQWRRELLLLQKVYLRSTLPLIVCHEPEGSLLVIEVDRLRIQGRLLARAGDYATAANIYQKVLESWYARGSLHYFVQ